MSDQTAPETIARGIAVGILTALACTFSPEQVEMLAAKVRAAMAAQKPQRARTQRAA